MRCSGSKPCEQWRISTAEEPSRHVNSSLVLPKCTAERMSKFVRERRSPTSNYGLHIVYHLTVSQLQKHLKILRIHLPCRGNVITPSLTDFIILNDFIQLERRNPCTAERMSCSEKQLIKHLSSLAIKSSENIVAKPELSSRNRLKSILIPS